MVDTAQAKIRLAMKHFINSQFHTINRRSRTLPRLYTSKGVYLMKTKGRANGNGMAHPRLRLVRSHYYNLTEIFNRFNKVVKPWCGDTIIIRDQDNSLFCAYFLFAGGS